MRKIIALMFILLFVAGCASIEVTRTGSAPAEAELEPEPQVQESPPEEPEPQAEEPQAEEPPVEEPEPEQPQSHQVQIGGGRFNPDEFTINVGETVTWTNNYDAPIVVAGPRGTFNVKMYAGESHSYTFESPGKYSIIKLVDPIFYGYVVVKE